MMRMMMGKKCEMPTTSSNHLAIRDAHPHQARKPYQYVGIRFQSLPIISQNQYRAVLMTTINVNVALISHIIYYDDSHMRLTHSILKKMKSNVYDQCSCSYTPSRENPCVIFSRGTCPPMGGTAHQPSRPPMADGGLSNRRLYTK